MVHLVCNEYNVYIWYVMNTMFMVHLVCNEGHMFMVHLVCGEGHMLTWYIWHLGIHNHGRSGFWLVYMTC